MNSCVVRRASRRSAVAFAALAAVAACSSSSGTGGHPATSVAVGSPSAAPTGTSSTTPTTPTSTPAGPGGSHLVGYDLKLHRIDVFDDQLKLVGHLSVPALKSPLPHVGPGDTMVLTGTDGNAVVDLHSGQATDFTLPSTDEFPQYAPPDAKVLAFTDADERVSVLNLATGAVTDGREIVGDPHALLTTSYAFANAITFYAFGASDTATLVVPYDGSAAYAVPGLVLSLADRTALTTEQAGSTSTRVAVRDGSTETGSVTVAGNVRGGLLTGPTTATLVTDDGRVLSADLAHHTTTSLAALGGTDQLAVPISADRLLVGRPDDAETNRLVDDQGHVVASFPPVGGQAVWPGPGYRPIGARCFITQTGSKPVVVGGDVSVRDAETGQARAQLSGSAVLAPTPDGCSAANNVSTNAEAVLDGTLHKFPPFSGVTAVSPDLKFVVASGRPRPGDSTGWAAVDVATGRSTTLPPGIYTWVSGAAP